MNIIQMKRTITPGASPPLLLASGEIFGVMDQVGVVDVYIGDSAGTPVLVNPAPTPIGGVELAYQWNSDPNLGTPPAVGDVKIDGPQNAVGATTMSISDTTRLGTITDPIWPLVQVGDLLGLFEQGGGGGAGGETFYWDVSGPAVDMGAYWDIPGTVSFYGGNDIDDGRRTSVFWVQNPVNAAKGDLVSDPGAGDNLVQPTADHPAMRFTRFDAASVANVAEFHDELGNVAGGFTVEGTQAGGDLHLILDAGTFT